MVERRATDEPAKERYIWQGLGISIETPGGDVRYPGSPLETKVPDDCAYGYFVGLPASDGDSLDVILGPEFTEGWSGPVFLASQLEPDGETFLQWKVLLGFASQEDATRAFIALWPQKMFGGIWSIQLDAFLSKVLHEIVVDEDEQPEPSDVPDEARTAGASDAIVWHGLKIALEAKGGEKRPSGDEQLLPNEWRGLGYFEGLTDKNDPDHQELDVAVGPGDLDDSAYLAIQLDKKGRFRQWKVFLGFDGEAQVEAGFKLVWHPDTFGGVWTVPAKRFRKLVLPRLTKEATVDGAPRLTRCAVLHLEVDPARITPPHGVKNVRKKDRITESLRRDGWDGRPLLVYRSGGQYVALTGSHRLAAACEAGIERVPVLLIEDGDFEPATYTALDEAQDNYDRLRALEDLRDARPDTQGAYELMLEEVAEKNKARRFTRSSAAVAEVSTPSGSIEVTAADVHATRKPKFCSHCGKAVTANDLFGRGDRWFHRPCISKGPIALDSKTASFTLFGEKLTRTQYRKLVHKAVRARLLGTIEGIEVYKVDGEWVRDHLDVDFVQGGSFARYGYVPDRELWVEALLSDKDAASTIVHEVIECDAMLEGLSYDKAHGIAAEIEAFFREQYEDGHTPFKAAETFLCSAPEEDMPGASDAEAPDNLNPPAPPTPEDLEGERREYAAARSAAVSFAPFSALDIGELFFLMAAPKKEVLKKVAPNAYENKDGQRAALEQGARVMRFKDPRAIEVTAADLSGLQLKRKGYQRYVADHDDGEKKHKVWIGGDHQVQHGSYDGGKRQRRKTVWVVKVDGDEVGTADTLREAKELAEGKLSIIREAPSALEQAPAPTEPELAGAPPAVDPMAILRDPSLLEFTAKDLEPMHLDEDLGPSEWMGHEPPMPAAPPPEPAYDPRIHRAPSFEFVKPLPSPGGPLPPLEKPPALAPEEEASVSEAKQVREQERVAPEVFKRTYEQFKLKPNGGYENIANIMKLATPEELEFYGKWYDHAHEDVVELAKRYGKSVPVVAGIVAALSPNMPWDKNLELAERVLQGQTRSSAWPINLQKALHILKYEDLTELTKGEWGPKVGPFFESIASPKDARRRIVIDGHAANIWRGSYRQLSNATDAGGASIKGVSVGVKERAEMQNDYKRAGDAFGVTPQAAQAISWVIWREVIERNQKVELSEKRKLKKQKAGALEDAGFGLTMPFEFVASLGADALEKLVRQGWRFTHVELEEPATIEVTAADVSAAIPEPKRKTTTFEEWKERPLALAPAGGLQNIIKVLSMADDAEVDFWSQWYKMAHDDVAELASKYELPFDVVAAVTAVLSPGNKWAMNIRAAEQLISKDLGGAAGVAAYPANIKKAVDILEKGNMGAVTGPKVTVFYEALKNPDVVKDKLVLDGHAINIWRGEKMPLKGLKMPAKAERAQMEQDYARAADMFGLSPQAVQAITWYIWKSVLQPEKAKATVVGKDVLEQKRKKKQQPAPAPATPEYAHPALEPAPMAPEEEEFEQTGTMEVAAERRIVELEDVAHLPPDTVVNVLGLGMGPTRLGDLFVRSALMQSDKQPGENAGVFLRVPESLAKMWPKDGRAGEDDSPPHFTVLYLGPIEAGRKDELVELVSRVARAQGPIPVELSKGVDWFENHKGQQIAHKGVHPKTLSRLEELHGALKEAVVAAGFEVKHKEPYIAHATLAYCDEQKYDGNVPEGGWSAKELEVWGWPTDEKITLGSPLARAAKWKVPVALGDEPIFITAADLTASKRRRRKEKRKRFAGEVYWLPKDGSFARTRSGDAGDGATEIRLDPGARVLREGERDFIDLGSDASIEDVMKMAFEKGYDAVRVKDRLAILNQDAIAERTPASGRPGWHAG